MAVLERKSMRSIEATSDLKQQQQKIKYLNLLNFLSIKLTAFFLGGGEIFHKRDYKSKNVTAADDSSRKKAYEKR